MPVPRADRHLKFPASPVRQTLLFGAVALFLGLVSEPANAGSELTFERDIRPIFRKHCLDCHGATEEIEGNLDLRLVRFVSKGGDSGPALVPGDLQNSLLLERIRSGEMPPGEGKVSPDELKILEDWIQSGAKTARPEPETLAPGLPILPEEREWWAFRPLTRPEVPETGDERVRSPIDALLRKQMPSGLGFSPDADRRTLMLRACFDLTGLPPTTARMQEFLNDARPDAYERLIDELLASPQYGERWGRHWLDVVGYADSEGRTTSDAVRKWAYKYRDYVIKSLNAGKPFDRFLHEQLAGDELAGPVQGDLTPEQIELLTATGFLRMAADGTGSGDNTEESRNLVIADTIQIVSSSLLGLSVACAQCHDHRYDPISHTDYFALRAVFEPAFDWKKWKTPAQRQRSLATKQDREETAKIEAEAQVIVKERKAKLDEYMAAALTKELEKYEEPLREQLRVAYHTPEKERTAEQKGLLSKHPSVNLTPGNLYQYNQAAADDLKKYDERIAEVRARKPQEEFLRILTEAPGSQVPTHLFYRGDHRQPKQAVSPAALSVLCSEDQFVAFPEKDPNLPTTGRRLAFAKWLTSPQNPITSRVLVNRVWLHHFGRAIVDTPADFGRLGTAPTHPELLDWLATEFQASGWDLKQLHRTIMLSTAYRQSSEPNPQFAAIDPANRNYWRRDVIRLDAEIVRDRVLAATGKLDLSQFGPPIPVAEDKQGQTVVDQGSTRRSLYIQQRRSQPVPMLQAFDAPVMAVNCEKRPTSTVATQSLMLMNNSFSIEQAQALAQLLLKQTEKPLSEAQLAALPQILPAPGPQWKYGYGGYSKESGDPVRFTEYPHFDGKSRAWRGGAAVPDAKIGWSFLNPTGGHTGVSPDFSPIRRWIAPAAGTVKVNGTLSHASASGDGVQGQLVSNDGKLIAEWVSHNNKVTTSVAAIPVQAGDVLDFVTNCRADVNADSFGWEVSLTLTLPGDSRSVTISSTESFGGPDKTQKVNLSAQQLALAWQHAYCRLPSEEELNLAVRFVNQQIQEMTMVPRELPQGTTVPLQALANLCQVLLTSNEFLYVE